MANLDTNTEANLEAKYIAVNKADMKLHLAKLELRDAVCEALCSILPKDAEMDEIIRTARTIVVYQRMDKNDKKKIVKLVYERLNN
jgi:hypothetical protein